MRRLIVLSVGWCPYELGGQPALDMVAPKGIEVLPTLDAVLLRQALDKEGLTQGEDDSLFLVIDIKGTLVCEELACWLTCGAPVRHERHIDVLRGHVPVQLGEVGVGWLVCILALYQEAVCAVLELDL